MHSVLPYEKTAKFYDYLLSHVDYKEWAEYIHQLISLHKPPQTLLLDIACGTGAFLEEVLKYGYDCTGVELSTEMINQAKLKLPETNFEVADMLHYEATEKLSIITCLFDSMNYLNDGNDLLCLLDQCYFNLNDNGVFIFDTVTESHCLTHYFDYSEFDSIGEINYERRCQYDIKNKIQRSTFIITDQDGDFIEVHNQHIYSHKEILNIIENSKLDFEAAYPDFTFSSVDKKSERIHYVCRKII